MMLELYMVEACGFALTMPYYSYGNQASVMHAIKFY